MPNPSRKRINLAADILIKIFAAAEGWKKHVIITGVLVQICKVEISMFDCMGT